METKWTPGPWIFEAGVEDSEGEFFVCHPGTVCDATTVCNPTFEADAHLIAAAPALYEALDTLFTDPQFQVSIGGNPNMVEALMARCNAALALARGEHPTPPESRVGLDPDAGTRQHGEIA